MNWTSRAKAGPRLGCAVLPPPSTRRVAEPRRASRPATPRLEWALLDVALLAEARDALSNILNLDPPTRVSCLEIERWVRRENYLHLRRKKLPPTTAFVDQASEDLDHFRKRRMLYVIDQHIRDGLPLTVSDIQRRAGLKPDWRGRIAEAMRSARTTPMLKYLFPWVVMRLIVPCRLDSINFDG